MVSTSTTTATNTSTATITTTTTATTSTSTTTTTTTSTTTTTTTTTTTSTTTYRPMNPGYLRRELSGLVCHTHTYGFLRSAIPDSCDFVMVDVPTSLPQPHPLYSYMATIDIDPDSYETDIVQHMGSAQGKALLLAVERRVLRSSPLQQNAVARGLVQKVVDMNAHGIALSDRFISEADTRVIAQDAQILSEEIQSYHGLIRYDTFLGNRSALRSLMLDVISKASITFVYRVSGISRAFTHLYFDNFYSTRMNERNLSSIIDDDLAHPLNTYAGNRSIAISMTLSGKRCAPYTLANFATHGACDEFDLDMSVLCALPPGYIQCLHYSIMTRHYDTGEHLPDDVFFEVEHTFTAKVRLILQQLRQAGAPPVAFLLERYDKETQHVITYYDQDRGADVRCDATPFGFTAGVKAELANL
ncbi:uncharacterized protein LOC119440262 isoform X3 [Dermacentor silvarum]|uniref:uncharacterized protein LOC119440262 isoform X2 n=1 Tax=Dermacentor silvarum TaxID=543639 RepID=UPI002100AF80|nr:uncharacterized protein LOC119440262 isoform X2 [Dermacentor silvarum]XP_049517459.1 uncharacterized protein LOC119440262 isoform X3 [Dermacentor silvarum]